MIASLNLSPFNSYTKTEQSGLIKTRLLKNLY
jgi:hypothetical protein